MALGGGDGRRGLRLRPGRSPLGKRSHAHLVGEIGPPRMKLAQTGLKLGSQVRVVGELTVEITDGSVGPVEGFEEYVQIGDGRRRDRGHRGLPERTPGRWPADHGVGRREQELRQGARA